jgi:hypothetical protein
MLRSLVTLLIARMVRGVAEERYELSSRSDDEKVFADKWNTSTLKEVTLQPNKKRDDASGRRSPERWEVGRACNANVSDKVKSRVFAARYFNELAPKSWSRC